MCVVGRLSLRLEPGRVSWARWLSGGEAAAAELEAETCVAAEEVLLNPAQDLLEGGGKAAEFGLGRDQRRQRLDDVHVVPRDLGEDLMLVEQRDRDHLREQTRLATLDGLPDAAGGAA